MAYARRRARLLDPIFLASLKKRASYSYYYLLRFGRPTYTGLCCYVSKSTVTFGVLGVKGEPDEPPIRR